MVSVNVQPENNAQVALLAAAGFYAGRDIPASYILHRATEMLTWLHENA